MTGVGRRENCVIRYRIQKYFSQDGNALQYILAIYCIVNGYVNERNPVKSVPQIKERVC